MSPFRDRRERRRERERAKRQARREALSAKLGRADQKSEEQGIEAKPKGPKPKPRAKVKAKPAAAAKSIEKAKPKSKPKAGGTTGREARRAERAAARRSAGAEPRSAKRPRQRTRRKARQARRKVVLFSKSLRSHGAAWVARVRIAWRRGLRSTRRRAHAAGPAIRRGGRRAWGLIAPVIALAFSLAGRIDRALRAVLTAIGSFVGAAVRRLDRLLTPVRGILVVTIACSACLVLSQFVDYRGVEIGQPGYVDVSAIASAPQVDLQRTGEAHSYLLIPLAAFAVVMAAVAVFARRRRAGELVALAGLVGIGVTLLIDMPRGLDAGLAGARFAGAHPVLKDGFYAQLAACAGLVICGLALSLNMRQVRTGARKRARRSRRRRQASRSRSKAPSLAESGT
jgi:hypothetical protein